MCPSMTKNETPEIRSGSMAKYENLKACLSSMGSVAVAFSGGVDSTLLLFAAREALGDKAIAITAHASWFPAREQEEADAFCREHGIRQILINLEGLPIEGFRENPPDRCYLCKKALFLKMKDTAKELGMAVLAEGSNLDDMGDYRPGLAAIKELQVESPLRKAGLSKAEIRAISKELGLPTWDKPSCACLASRFVYGETITLEKLHMVDRAEEFLHDAGFRQARVRLHGNLARIELLPSDIALAADPVLRSRISQAFRELGFSYITLDLEGYRTGSLNETLKSK